MESIPDAAANTITVTAVALQNLSGATVTVTAYAICTSS
jgi:hypothetical protein